MALMLAETVGWTAASLFSRRVRLGRPIMVQMHRVGLRSLGIVVLVQLFIGVILALQMTPPLADYGQQGQVSRIIGVAGFRMLGPIITGVVLSGFAGASIAAELGTMVVSEEIEALEAMAIDPVRFLVVPRVVATLVMMVLLTVIADLMIASGGFIASRVALGPESYVGYWTNMREQLLYRDFFTGLVQAAGFGVLISLIACYKGLTVRGGAEGVGRATTMTVVYSIVSIVLAAALFTMVFYTFGL
jgi:phospholipid/cholesterol/gamma-HCH transport system permease protein